jgi:hypothetical protein
MRDKWPSSARCNGPCPSDSCTERVASQRAPLDHIERAAELLELQHQTGQIEGLGPEPAHEGSATGATIRFCMTV